jgi:hypothetical protein
LQVPRHREEARAWDLAAGAGRDQSGAYVRRHRQEEWQWDAQVSMPAGYTMMTVHLYLVCTVWRCTSNQSKSWLLKIWWFEYWILIWSHWNSGCLSWMNRNDAGGEHCWDVHKRPCSG